MNAWIIFALLMFVQACSAATCGNGLVESGEACDDYVCCNSTCNGFVNTSIITANDPGCKNFTMRVTDFQPNTIYRWYLISKPPGTFPLFNETFLRSTVQLDGNGIYVFGVQLTRGNCTWNSTYTINCTDCCGNQRLDSTEQCDGSFAQTGCCRSNCTYMPVGSPCNGTILSNCTKSLTCAADGQCVSSTDAPFTLTALTPQNLLDYTEISNAALWTFNKTYTFVVRYVDPDNTTGNYFWNVSVDRKQPYWSDFVGPTSGIGPAGRGNITITVTMVTIGWFNFTLRVWDGCNRMVSMPLKLWRWNCPFAPNPAGLCSRSNIYCQDNCSRTVGYCGDGILQPGEICDPVLQPCCASDCSGPANFLTLCRASRGVCDNAEYCTGSSFLCPTDTFKSNSTACGGGSTVCNPTIACTGTSPLCPTYSNFNLSSLNGLRCSTGTPPCLFPKICKDGACVNANFTGKCRKSTGVCDPEEYCLGNGTATCPANKYLPVGTPCYRSKSNCTYGNSTCAADGSCAAGTQGSCVLQNGTYVLPGLGVPSILVSNDTSSLIAPAYLEFCNTTKCDLYQRVTGSGDCLIEGIFYDQNDRPPYNDCFNCEALFSRCNGQYCQPTTSSTTWYLNPGDTCTSTLQGSCLRTSECGGSSSVGTNWRSLGLGGACVQTYYNSAISCTADTNVSITPLPTGVCTGTSPWCSITSIPKPTGVCRPAAGPCDVPDYYWLNGVCGDDIFMPSTTVCRPAAGPCDLPEYCTGNSSSCPPDVLKPSTTVCRTGFLCDAPEYCTGVTPYCPDDVVYPVGTECTGYSACAIRGVCGGYTSWCNDPAVLPDGSVCREAADACDSPEYCLAGVCPADTRANSSTLCRPLKGPCDMPEYCTGGSCPADAMMPAGTLCRSSVDSCDAPEYCDGINYDCPADAYRSSLYICRAPAGACDAQENCTGLSTACPTNLFLNSSVTCRPSNGTCDVPETCSGVGPDCPVDLLHPAGTLCYTAQGLCDTNSTCTGSSPLCPNATLVSAGTVCRPAAGVCDVPETCPGNDFDCPPDVFLSNTVLCAAATQDCQMDAYCFGNQSACPQNAYKANGTLCHLASSSCDSNSYCTGNLYDCPSPTLLAAGSYCNLDGLNCTIDECDGAGNCLFVSQSCGCTQNEDCASNAACVTGWCHNNACQQNITSGFCFVDNGCFANGTLNPLNSCQYCRSDVSTTSWVPTTLGSPCDTGSPSGSCSTQDTCNGLGVCIDRYLNGSTCRAAVSVCDQAEFCPGGSDYCPPDSFSGVIPCYNSTGPCDVTLYCSSVSPLCPTNIYAPSTQVCRSSQGDCDIEEYCTGNSTGCPPDQIRPAGFTCRSAVGSCDIPETCDGISFACPTDVIRPSTFICHAPLGMCDKPINCSGVSGICASPELYPAGHVCRNANGTCDVPEVCDGLSADCPFNSFSPAGTICRPMNGSCDRPETCPGNSNECPADELQPSGYACFIPGGPCQATTYCDGSSRNCSTAPFYGTNVLCRESNNTCDAPEFCTGASDACPPDLDYADGTSCSDDIFCNGQESCAGGVCIRTPLVCAAPPCYTATCDEGSSSCIVLPDGPLGTSCYTGPNGTLGIGSCAGGEVTCVSGSVQCVGQVVPVPEICFNGIDDNCNGFADEGCSNVTDECQTSDDCPYNDQCQSANCVNGVCVYRVEDEACWIDDSCWSAGDRNPTNPCEVCLPSAKRQRWTLISGNISDGDICNGLERCWNGHFYLDPKPLVCLTNEMVPCSNATCDPMLGCLIDSLPDRTPCWYPEADCAAPTMCLSGHCICKGRLKEIGDASYFIIALIIFLLMLTLMCCCCLSAYYAIFSVEKKRKVR